MSVIRARYLTPAGAERKLRVRCSTLPEEDKTNESDAARRGGALASVPLAASAQGTYPNTGRDLAAACAICHGTNGVNAGGPAQPRRPAAATTSCEQLRDFRDGKRPATIMHQIAKGYTDDQIAAVSAYFSAQKAK